MNSALLSLSVGCCCFRDLWHLRSGWAAFPRTGVRRWCDGRFKVWAGRIGWRVRGTSVWIGPALAGLPAWAWDWFGGLRWRAFVPGGLDQLFFFYLIGRRGRRFEASDFRIRWLGSSTVCQVDPCRFRVYCSCRVTISPWKWTWTSDRLAAFWALCFPAGWTRFSFRWTRYGPSFSCCRVRFAGGVRCPASFHRAVVPFRCFETEAGLFLLLIRRTVFPNRLLFTAPFWTCSPPPKCLLAACSTPCLLPSPAGSSYPPRTTASARPSARRETALDDLFFSPRPQFPHGTLRSPFGTSKAFTPGADCRSPIRLQFALVDLVFYPNQILSIASHLKCCLSPSILKFFHRFLFFIFAKVFSISCPPQLSFCFHLSAAPELDLVIDYFR